MVRGGGAQRVGHGARRRDARPRRPRRRSTVDGTLCASAAARRGAASRACSPSTGCGISSGDTASVGVGGLTLGGGIGWMVRAWGLAADQLVGAQLVTAHGRRGRGDRAVAPRAALGAARRRRQLRGRDALRLPRARAAVGGVRDPRCRRVTHGRCSRALRDTMRDAPRELTVTYMDVPPMDPSAPAGRDDHGVLDRRRRVRRARRRSRRCSRSTA